MAVMTGLEPIVEFFVAIGAIVMAIFLGLFFG